MKKRILYYLISIILCLLYLSCNYDNFNYMNFHIKNGEILNITSNVTVKIIATNIIYYPELIKFPETVLIPNSTNYFYIYYTIISNLSSNISCSELLVDNDVAITLFYNKENLTYIGFTNNFQLALYGWDRKDNIWIRYGGAVDSNENSIKCSTYFLRQYYTIFAEPK